MQPSDLTAATKVHLVDTVRALQEARDEPINAHSTLMRLRPQELRKKIDSLCAGRWIVSEDGNIHDSGATEKETELNDTMSYTDLDAAVDEDLSDQDPEIVKENLTPGYMNEDGLDVISDQAEIEETKTTRPRAPKDGVIRVLGEIALGRPGCAIHSRRSVIQDGMTLADYVVKAAEFGGEKKALKSLGRVAREGSIRIDAA